MNSEFWNIFQWISNGFSDRIPIGIVPSPVGLTSIISQISQVLTSNHNEIFRGN
jgi:hypothetical protein